MKVLEQVLEVDVIQNELVCSFGILTKGLAV